MFISRIRQFLLDEEGAVAIEYALLAALIAVVIAISAKTLGENIAQLFSDIADCMTNPTTCSLLQ